MYQLRMFVIDAVNVPSPGVLFCEQPIWLVPRMEQPESGPCGETTAMRVYWVKSTSASAAAMASAFSAAMSAGLQVKERDRRYGPKTAPVALACPYDASSQ